MLVRSAHSANIKERRDCSCALFDADGEMVMQAEHIPVHLGAMPASVVAVAEARRAAGGESRAPRPRSRRPTFRIDPPLTAMPSSPRRA